MLRLMRSVTLALNEIVFVMLSKCGLLLYLLMKKAIVKANAVCYFIS